MIRAHLELSRLSNAPTCVTNVLTGTAIGVTSATFSWMLAICMSAAILCLYVGGMALNDFFDRRVDARHRPDRPIPSGRITPSGAGIFGTTALLVGLIGGGLLAPAAFVPLLLLVAAIVIYDLTHKLTASAVVLMGMCRGLVYIVAAAAAVVPLDWRIAGPLAIALTIYTTLVTIIARAEDGGHLGPKRWLVLLMPLAIAIPALLIQPTTIAGRWVSIAAAAAVLLWLTLAARDLLGTTPRVRSAILKWLSGICLIDVLYLGMLDEPVAACVAAVLFLVTVAAHRIILGT
jgi:4-hydroxybenzoate polyprenyltransferase